MKKTSKRGREINITSTSITPFYLYQQWKSEKGKRNKIGCFGQRQICSVLSSSRTYFTPIFLQWIKYMPFLRFDFSSKWILHEIQISLTLYKWKQLNILIYKFVYWKCQPAICITVFKQFKKVTCPFSHILSIFMCLKGTKYNTFCLCLNFHKLNIEWKFMCYFTHESNGTY